MRLAGATSCKVRSRSAWEKTETLSKKEKKRKEKKKKKKEKAQKIGGLLRAG